MDRLHVLQPPLTSAGARRLSGELRSMIDAGVDPGSRQPQIRGIGETLETMVVTLRAKLEALGISEFDDWIADLERLTRLARTYEADLY